MNKNNEMRVLTIIEQFTDIVETATTVPVLGKTVIDKDAVLELIEEMKNVLPEEIQKANFIVQKKDEILNEAAMESDRIIKQAKIEQKKLIAEHVISKNAEKRAADLIKKTDEYIEKYKKENYATVDKVLYDFQKKMANLHDIDFQDMFQKFQAAFQSVNDKIEKNREQAKNLAANVKTTTK